MNFAAVYHAHMCQGVLVSASDRALGAWMRVLVYASYVEKDRIPARQWRDREWRATANVSKRGVERAVAEGLLAWDGDDLVVHGFDHRGLAKIKAKRENGKFGYLGAPHGIKGGRPRKDGKKKPPLTDPTLSLPFPHDPDPDGALDEEDGDPDQGPEAWTHPDIDPDFDYEAGTTKANARAQEQRLADLRAIQRQNARQSASAAAEGDGYDGPMIPAGLPPETSHLTVRPQAIAGATRRSPEDGPVGVSEAPASAPAQPLTGLRLLQIFQKVRAEMDSTLFPWTIPPTAPDKAAQFALQFEGDAAAIADIEPTIRLLLEQANEGKIRNADLIRTKPAFAFGVWCSEFTPLREELRARGKGADGRPRRKSIYQDL